MEKGRDFLFSYNLYDKMNLCGAFSNNPCHSIIYYHFCKDGVFRNFRNYKLSDLLCVYANGHLYDELVKRYPFRSQLIARVLDDFILTLIKNLAINKDWLTLFVPKEDFTLGVTPLEEIEELGYEVKDASDQFYKHASKVETKRASYYDYNGSGYLIDCFSDDLLCEGEIVDPKHNLSYYSMLKLLQTIGLKCIAKPFEKSKYNPLTIVNRLHAQSPDGYLRIDINFEFYNDFPIEIAPYAPGGYEYIFIYVDEDKLNEIQYKRSTRKERETDTFDFRISSRELYEYNEDPLVLCRDGKLTYIYSNREDLTSEI